MSTTTIDVVQPWRKSFPFCRPPTPGDKADAIRFAKEFPEGADEQDAGDNWTVGDVLRGDHDGGLAAGAAVLALGMGAVAVATRRRRDNRRKFARSLLLKYLQDEDLKEKLRPLHGEAAWREYLRLEVGTPTEATSEDKKGRIRAASILGAVGFNARSIAAFELFITGINASIEPAADRMSEHDMAVVMLKAIIATRVPNLAGEAGNEYTCNGADRKYQQAAPNPTHLRSLRLATDYFHRNWENLFENGMIAQRPAGGKMTGAGSSTHVDGHVAEANVLTLGWNDAYNVTTGEYGYNEAAPTPSPIDAWQINLASVGSVDGNSAAVSDLRDAFVAAMSSSEGRRVIGKICFRCFGEGHIQPNCPSQIDDKRTLEGMIVMLTALAAKRQGVPRGHTVQNGPRNRKVPGWWRGQSRSGGTAGKPQAYVLEDGSIVDEMMVHVGRVTSEQAKRLHLDQAVIADGSRIQEVTDADTGEVVASGEAAQPEGKATSTPDTTCDIEQQMLDPFSSDAAEICPESANSDDESMSSVSQAPTAVHNRAPRKHARQPNVLMQVLSCLLLPFCSTATLMLANASGADGAVHAISHTPRARVFVPKTRLTLQQVAEDAMWRARGYEVHHTLDSGPSHAPHMYSMTVDSGAGCHCSGLSADVPLATADAAPPKVKIRVASGDLVGVNRRGPSVQVTKTRQSGVRETMFLTQFMYSKHLPPTTRLFSVRKGYERDGVRSYFNGVDKLVLPGNMRVPFQRDQHRYIIRAVPLAVASKHSTVAPAVYKLSYTEHALADVLRGVGVPTNITDDDHSDVLRHKRCGHFSHRRTGVQVPGCPGCMLGGARFFTKSSSRGSARSTPLGQQFTRFGERVSSDLVVNLPPSAGNAFTMAMVHYDWGTGTVSANYLKTKSGEAMLAAFQQFEADHQKELEGVGGHVLEWHKDNEITTAEIEAYLEKVMTSSTFAIPYDKNTNPGSERAIGIILRPMRIMAATHTGGGDRFQYWPWLMNQACALHNWLKSRKGGYERSPDTMSGTHRGLPATHTPRVMLCKCYAAIPHSVRNTGGKLEPTAYECTYLGWDRKRSGHFVIVHALNRITTVRGSNLKFAENDFHYLPSVHPSFHFPETEGQIERDPQQPPARVRPAPTIRVPTVAGVPQGTMPANQIPPGTVHAVPLPTRIDAADVAEAYFMCPSEPIEVLSVKSLTGTIPLPHDEVEALDPNNQWCKKWLQAMLDDVQKKHDNKAWTIVSRAVAAAAGLRVHKGKWAFRITFEDDGTPVFRARWVFCGYSQSNVVDYDKTFIGAISQIAERLLICDAAQKCLPLYDCDIRAAFTTATMDRELYVEGPRPFVSADKCARADKSLEGSKQAGNLYYTEHADCLQNKLNCTRAAVEPNLYKREDKDGEWIKLAVLTDNCLMLPSSPAMLKRFMDEYRKHYTLTGGNVTTKFNGVWIDQSLISKGIVRVHQKQMIEDVYAKYLPAETRPRTSPILKPGKDGVKAFMHQKGAESEADRALMSDKQYMNVLGAIAYITHKSRPDCRFHTSFLGQFMQHPSIDNWNHLLAVTSFMYHTRDLCITYGGAIKQPRVWSKGCDPPFKFPDFADNNGHALWTDATFGFHMQSAYIIMYMNAAIGWASRKIKVQATSSAETETIGGVHGGKAEKFAQNVMRFLNMPITAPTPLMVDNRPMWFNVRNDAVSAETAHWGIWQRFVRECYLHKLIEAYLIGTDDELADLLTKAIAREDERFKRFQHTIMNVGE